MIKIEDDYKVYAHINKSNGKIYIGITGREPKVRWQNGTAYSRNLHFNYAIQKYGWDNFEHEIIASGLTKEEAENFEILLIKKLETQNPEKGYNVDNGGNLAGKHSKETIEKFSGKNNWCARQIICVTTGKIFDTITEGSKYYNIDTTSISGCCSKKRQMAGSYNGIPLKWMYYEEYLINGDNTSNTEMGRKKVICLNNYEIYCSTRQTGIEFNIPHTKVVECCSLKILSVIKDNNQLRFMYYDDYLKYGEFDFSKTSMRLLNKVICINDNKIYDSVLKASQEANFNYKSITKICRIYHYKKELISIKNELNGEEKTWMYYEDYLKQ